MNTESFISNMTSIDISVDNIIAAIAPDAAAGPDKFYVQVKKCKYELTSILQSL